jgi:hypothetical protein
MIRLAEIVAQYAPELLKAEKLLPSQLAALNAFQNCRSATSPKMQLICDPCAHEVWLPHSCGNRHCPHCQAHESQRWIDQQLQKLVPGNYAMITFTLPAEFRSLAWHHQRELYELITRNAWDTVNTFSRNDKKLRGSAGATTVLHTHSRRLDYHPHVHLLMPAVAFDAKSRLWREKDGGYLFCHKALAKVFRAKMLDSIRKAGLTLPASYPTDWVVDCKAVGTGQKALVYLGRYLYRGVLPEKNIVSNQNGLVTFRYQNSATRKMETRTLGGVAFLKLLLQHILPKGFRRARNYGFLHPNSKLVKLVQWIKKVIVRPPKPRPTVACVCCGNPLRILRTRVKTRHLMRSKVLDWEMTM